MGKNYKIPLPGPTPENGENYPPKRGKITPCDSDGDSESIFRDSTLLRFHSFFCFSLRNIWRFQARDSGNRAIRDSRFCAAKDPSGQMMEVFFFFCPPLCGGTPPPPREAPVRFGSVTVWGWKGSSGSGFRFWRFLCKRGLSVFQYSLTREGRFQFRFAVPGKAVPTVPVPLSVSRKNGSDSSGFRFRFGSWATLPPFNFCKFPLICVKIRGGTPKRLPSFESFTQRTQPY